MERIFHDVEADNPSASRRVVRTIYERVNSLKAHSYQGRTGRVGGTRATVDTLALPGRVSRPGASERG